MTIFLPLIMLRHPTMIGPQHVSIVLVGPHAHAVSELAQVQGGLAWWTARYGDVTWQVDVATRPVPAQDIAALDVCDDRTRQAYLDQLGPLPDNAIVLIDSYESGAHFACHGEPRGVVDYTVPGLALVETSSAAGDDFGVVMAHVAGHLYGAPDSTDGDIMDWWALWAAYAAGMVSPETAAALGRQESRTSLRWEQN